MNGQEQNGAFIRANPLNPGQFFACCGLLELAQRLWGDVEGWFDAEGFRLRRSGNGQGLSIEELVTEIHKAPLLQLDPKDDKTGPLELSAPFGLLLDWWQEERALKTWAGSMSNLHIAKVMQETLKLPRFHDETLLNQAELTDRAPFCFDARKGSGIAGIDMGFSCNAVKIKPASHPAVEFLCLVGLQRFRPAATADSQTFDYYTWETPLGAAVAPAAVAGMLEHTGGLGYRFESAFRSNQKQHKGFKVATLLTRRKRWATH
jgi:hypothetical protein